MGFRCSNGSSPQIDINYGGSPYALNHGNGGGGGGGGGGSGGGSGGGGGNGGGNAGGGGGSEKETDNRGYYSPGLGDDIFPNVQADTMLLQAVDSVQLANTIQVKAIDGRRA